MTKIKSSSTEQVEKPEREAQPEAALPPLLRLKDVMRLVPLKKSTIWARARQGRFPKPVRYLGVTCWRRDEVLASIAEAGPEK